MLRSPAPPGAPEALPGRGDRARVAGADDGVEPADVDAELERVGRDDAEDLAGAQLPLDLAALLGQVAAAVAHDARGVDARAATLSRRYRSITSTLLRDCPNTMVGTCARTRSAASLTACFT